MSRKIAISTPATGDEEWLALREPLASGWLTQGPQVEAFERAFADRCGTRHAIATSSGTTALHLALTALGIDAGTEVIVPAFTWVATANAVVHAGARPVFVDVDPRTFNMDPARVAAAVTPATRAIIPVHLFGLCADMDAIAAAAPGIPLIEDAACATGAIHRWKPAGALGRAAIFSFHPRKTITTGEGGMVTTDDADLAARARNLRNFDAPDFAHLGFNYRMTDLQAAVGRVQLGKLGRLLDERERWAAYYRRELAGIPWLRAPEPPAEGRHGWQAYVCALDLERAPRPRDAIMAALAEAGIATRPGTHAIPMLPYYRDRFALAPDAYPHARDCALHTLAIPLHNRMTADDYAYVVAALRGLR